MPLTETKVALLLRSRKSLQPIVKSDEGVGRGDESSPCWNDARSGTARQTPYIIFTHAHPCHENGEDDDLYCGWWSDEEETSDDGDVRGASQAWSQSQIGSTIEVTSVNMVAEVAP